MPPLLGSHAAIAMLTLALLLTGCTGTADTQASTPQSTALPSEGPVSTEPVASPESVDSPPGDATSQVDPPRPSGVPDSDWTALLEAWDPAVSAEILATIGAGTDPDTASDWCTWNEATLRDESMGGAAESAAERYPESTLEEWNAFFESFFTDLDALRQERCADHG